MNVRDLTIALRPRTPWEAVDLGFLLARQHFKSLLLIGVVGFLPIWLLLIALCWQWSWLAPVLIWWLKPVYDRCYLYYLSRHLFGETVSVQQTLRQAPRLLFRGSVGMLLWRRLSPKRSMMLPIWDLEGLRGKAYRQRGRVVGRLGGATASLLTGAMHACDVLLMLSGYIFIIMMLPQGDWYSSYSEFYAAIQSIYTSVGAKMSYMLIPCIVYLFVEPFYLAAGFSLYLNSRTEQEAWDIELGLREFASRQIARQSGTVLPSKLMALTAPLLVGLSLCIGGMTRLEAVQPVPEVPDRIEEVYAHEDLQVKTQEVPQWIPPDWIENFFDWLLDAFSYSGSGAEGLGAAEVLLRVVGWLALFILVGVLIFVLIRLFRKERGGTQPPPDKRERPQQVMGMEVTRESIPPNVIEIAQQHWQSGEPRSALALLYRAALSELILQRDADIVSSDTEGECLQAGAQVLAEHDQIYFTSLTNGWITVAYSAHPLPDHSFQTLCQQWIFQK